MLEAFLAGPNGLFVKTLKALSHHIVDALNRMYDLSLQTAHVPEDWDCAIVTQVANTSRTRDPRQFRAINFTSVVCKII